LKKHSASHKTSRLSSKILDISEIERAVDRILFENKDKLTPDVKDVRKPDRSDTIELERFDTKSFSPETRKKKSIYFVKVKKKSDGKKGKDAVKEPTLVKEKKRNIFSKTKKGRDKKSSKDVNSSRKGASRSYVARSVGQLPPDEAKWLDKRINQASDGRKKTSSSLPSGKKPSQETKPDKKEERKKIISLFTKPSSESMFGDKEKTTVSDLDQQRSKQSIPDDAETSEKHLEKKAEDVKIDTTEKISSRVSEKSKNDESAGKEKKPREFSKEQKDEEKPSEIEEKDISPVMGDAESERVSLKDKDSGEPSVSDMSESDGLFEKSEKITVHGSKTEEFQMGEYNIKTSRKDSSKTKEHTLDGIRRKEGRKEPSAIEKIIKKEVTEFKTEHVEPEKTHRGKLGHSFSEKPKEIGDDFFTKKESDADKPSSSPKKIKLEEITPDGQIQFLKEANQLKSITLKKLGYSQGDWEELDFYPLEEPFAYVEIIREKETLDKRYVLVEIGLSEEESRILKFMGETLSGFTVDTNELESKGEETYLIEKMEQIIEDYTVKITSQSKKKIVYYLKKQFLGLGKLETLMKDPNIEDISCDGSGVMLFLYHRKYGSLKSNVTYDDEEELSDFVVKLAQKCGKHISIAEPMLDATMPDGSRLQMTLSTEVTTKGSTFTIRKFKEDPFSPPDLIEFNTMSAEMVAYLWLAVENGINALVAGGTAAGKTSTLNAFSLFIPQEAKIVSIEETREINLPHPNWIPGVSRSGFGEVVGGKVVGEIDMYDLMKAALRQRPEYILVGEIRGKEAYVLFQAMATGHTTYSTVHADSAASLIHRLEGKPINIPRIMLQALDIVCIQVISRIKNKRARRCKQIIEIIDIDPTTKEILTNEVFCWDPVDDKFVYSGKSYILERIRGEKDLSREEMTQEIKRRAHLLEWMNKNNIREFKKVATLVAQYVENPAQLMEKIRDGKLL